LVVYFQDGITENGPIENCSGLEFHATPYSTQLPDDRVDFPSGVAMHIPAGTGFRLQSHYLNATGDKIQAHVELTMGVAKEGTVKDHAGVLFLVQPNIDILPHSTGIVKDHCDLPMDMNIIKAASHMHKHGTHFLATVNGATLYETSTWSDP